VRHRGLRGRGVVQGGEGGGSAREVGIALGTALLIWVLMPAVVRSAREGEGEEEEEEAAAAAAVAGRFEGVERVETIGRVFGNNERLSFRAETWAWDMSKVRLLIVVVDVRRWLGAAVMHPWGCYRLFNFVAPRASYSMLVGSWPSQHMI
jgi:hypothetical protein